MLVSVFALSAAAAEAVDDNSMPVSSSICRVQSAHTQRLNRTAPGEIMLIATFSSIQHLPLAQYLFVICMKRSNKLLHHILIVHMILVVLLEYTHSHLRFTFRWAKLIISFLHMFFFYSVSAYH